MNDVPQAKVVAKSRAWWVWIIPLLAAAFAVVLVATYMVKRGPVITISMSDGAGLKPTHVLRSRGIAVGEVEKVTLADDMSNVVVTVRLDPAARDIARAGSRFWVVRPRVSLTEVGGLETIAGPRYLAVLPGQGRLQTHFVAMDDPPVVDRIDPDGLEIALIADRRGSLRPGAPVLYRQVRVGTVLSVGLASDAASVEMRTYIRPAYTQLVRTDTRFWNVSGIDLDLGITGLSLEIESLQSVVDGGVALATPDEPGETVATGHRFALHRNVDSDWLEWRPVLAVGSDLLPSGATWPDMQRFTVHRHNGPIWSRKRQYKGWGLPTTDGLIGPAALLQLEDGEKPGTIEVAGERFALTDENSAKAGPELACAAVSPGRILVWPMGRVRQLEQPEDCLVVVDPTVPPIAVTAARLKRVPDGWEIAEAVSFDQTMHGAAVLAQRDGQLLGLLLVEKGAGRIATIALPTDPK